MDDLLPELLDMILQSTIQLLKKPGNEETVPNDVKILISLASVSFCWFQCLSDPKFKKKVNRTLAAEIQKVKKRSAILRNNTDYLESEIQPNELISQLVQYGCLDARQVLLLRRLQKDTNKNSELLKMARKFSSQSHFRFEESLYLTHQRNALRIVEWGGGTVKLCIRNEVLPNKSALEKDLIVKLQKTLRENKEDKVWPHNLFNSVRIYDIVILSAQQGRTGVELWLWCQSQKALDRLSDVNDSELIKITDQLFNKFQSSVFVRPKTAFIDSSYFKCKVFVRRVSAKLLGSLTCPNGKNSISMSTVSSLQDKIYTTSDRTVYIYEDNPPYIKLQHTVNLPKSRIRHPLELAACQVNKCLYIIDRKEICIWKMTPANKYELKKWLSAPLPKLSVSSDGKVLLIDDYDLNHPELRIYSTNANFEISVPLRGHSYLYPKAAVELMPGVVAMQYGKIGPEKALKAIAIMRLNETGEILREVEFERLFRLASYSAGRLIAADEEANEVMLLDDQLKPLAVVLTREKEKRGLQWPRCFCYRKDTRELIVSHFGPSVVMDHYQFDVYKLSFNDECST